VLEPPFASEPPARPGGVSVAPGCEPPAGVGCSAPSLEPVPSAVPAPAVLTADPSATLPALPESSDADTLPALEATAPRAPARSRSGRQLRRAALGSLRRGAGVRARPSAAERARREVPVRREPPRDAPVDRRVPASRDPSERREPARAASPPRGLERSAAERPDEARETAAPWAPLVPSPEDVPLAPEEAPGPAGFAAVFDDASPAGRVTSAPGPAAGGAPAARGGAAPPKSTDELMCNPTIAMAASKAPAAAPAAPPPHQRMTRGSRRRPSRSRGKAVRRCVTCHRLLRRWRHERVSSIPRGRKLRRVCRHWSVHPAREPPAG
jgi:hypothetical protein